MTIRELTDLLVKGDAMSHVAITRNDAGILKAWLGTLTRRERRIYQRFTAIRSQTIRLLSKSKN